MAKQLDDYMQWPEIEALEYAECGRPETILGARMADRSHVLITTFQCGADRVTVKVDGVKKTYEMERMDEAGYYAVLIPAKKIPSYHFVVKSGKQEKEIVDIEGFGTYPKSKGVISLQNDRGTSYQAYIAVQNELVKAVNELRDEFAMRSFGKKFASCSEDEQTIVKEAIPQNISEAEPKDVGARRK